MADTWKSEAAASGISFDAVIPAGVLLCRTGYFSSAAQAVANGDTLQMVPVPKGAQIQGLVLNFNAGGASAAITGVGDGTLTTRFIGALSGVYEGLVSWGCCGNSINGAISGFSLLATTLIAGTIGTTQFNGAFNYEYTANDTIDILVGNIGTAWGATGIFKLSVFYKREGGMLDET